MTIRCATRATYLYKGTKFKSLMENIIGETYLGIKIFRFYLNCTNCSAQITYKTNPKDSDYIVESGAIWADKQKEIIGGDAIKSVENRNLESERVMDIVVASHELKQLKSRQANLNA
ncbi:uncharacterized protein LOC132048722 [Lycium ferocissimum]|uniref:uncharacterized protein LOC132048722 n=1 Tax=Lycium ferocissimum TaxID=112874 RepID=UPI002815C4C1|nr:uncharacterized protein LOC132048722 [Lycium ferocissimum]